MKKTLIASVLFSSLLAAQAQFSIGDLVVLRDGTGSAALSSAGTAIFLDQYTIGGLYVNSLAIPSTGVNALVNSGSATSEGALNLSANGQYLVFGGYNAAAGTASIASSTSASVPRGVGTVDAAGNYTLAATTSTSFSGNNIRSGASDGNGNYWASGAANGIVYLGGGSPGSISTTLSNTRVLQDVGGNLYFSTSSGSSRGIYQITGTPTSGANTAVSIINNGSSASPYDFAFSPNMTVAYVADSTVYTSSAGIGGIERWDFNGSSWVFDYSISYGTNGAVGLAVDFSGANPTIYGTSANGQNLFSVVDTGAASTGSLLATAGLNEVFRGLDWAPASVPEPSTLALGGLGLASLLALRRRRKI